MDETHGMNGTAPVDQFERQLTELLHSPQEPSPFEPRHRERLYAGVRARRRARAARRAAGSVLAVAGLGLGLLLWPHGSTDDRPSAPHPRPAISPAPWATTPPSPDESPSTPPSSSATSVPPGPGGTTAVSDPPATTRSSATTTAPPTATTEPPDGPSSLTSPAG